jgi:hypothetical protein
MEILPASFWLLSLLLYIGFLAWHENWRGALKPHEIDAFLAALKARETEEGASKMSVLEDFMRSDSGREFFMLNLIKFPDADIQHPATGETTTGARLLQSYFRPFASLILKAAGYPAYTARIQADYIEDWGVEANPGWEIIGLMRYRSRRDLMKAITNPKFYDVHNYKQLALESTLALPVETLSTLMPSPRVWLALVLISLSSLSHLIYLTF